MLIPNDQENKEEEYEDEEQEKEARIKHETEYLIYKMGIDAEAGFKGIGIPYSSIF